MNKLFTNVLSSLSKVHSIVLCIHGFQKITTCVYDMYINHMLTCNLITGEKSLCHDVTAYELSKQFKTMHRTTLRFGIRGMSDGMNIRVLIMYDNVPDLLCITVFNQRKDTLIKLLQIPGIDVCQVIMTTPLSLERGDKCHILVEGLVEIPCTSTKSYKLTCSAGRHFRVSRELMYSDGMVLLLEKTVSNIPQSSAVRTRYSGLHCRHFLQSVMLTTYHKYEQNNLHHQLTTSVQTQCDERLYVVVNYRQQKYIFILSCIENWRIPIDIKPSLDGPTVQVFKIKVVKMSPVHHIYRINACSSRIHLKTCWNLDEVRTLCRKCKMYQSSKSKQSIVPLDMFHSTKPRLYWNRIFSNYFRGVMYPYTKDYNGDQLSSINGNIQGLFFSAVLARNSLQPPPFSYFGDQRFIVKTSVLYNDWCNLYFADFYCHKSVHYVTLVITKPGSEADVFCCPRLPLLDNYSNPFLTLHRNLENETTCYVCLDPHVEVFYTDKLDIINILRQNLGCMTSVEPRGTGHSNPEGIPKNKSCTVCNV